MLKSVTVTNHVGDSLKMELGNPEKSGFLITNITGIGAPKGDIAITELAAADGSTYNSARAQTRNIVIEMKYLFKDSIEESRLRSYKFFPVKKKVNLVFETDSRMSAIDGYVESNDPDIFSKSESTQISIVCPYPYFHSVGDKEKQITKFSSYDPLFEFEFSNESLDEPLLEFSEIKIRAENIVTYYGDADTGFKMTIHASGAVANITIYNLETREKMEIDTEKIRKITGKAFGAGDDIVISTVVGNKYVHLVRNGKTTNIMNALGRYADWFKLSQGDNLFGFTAMVGVMNIQFEIENDLLYEGV